MANREIKTKVAIDGEKEYKESLKNINSALGTLKSELKLVESQYAGQANSYAALSAKGDVLSRIPDYEIPVFARVLGVSALWLLGIE